MLAENGYTPCDTETEYQGKYFYTIPIEPSLNGGVELEDYDRMHERITEAVGDQIREYTGS